MNRIKLLRARAGISQTELAERAGVSQPTVSDLEHKGITGRTRAETLGKIARALSVDVEELLDEEVPLANQAV
jgi:transcriptional regulator with XRE-family HTH domain